MRRTVRINEGYLRNVIRESVDRVLREDWKEDRYEYDHFQDEGNGGTEEYGLNMAQLIRGVGPDSDALHALGEETALKLIGMVGDDGKDEYLQPFIEGLIAVHMNQDDPYDVYKSHGIVRN